MCLRQIGSWQQAGRRVDVTAVGARGLVTLRRAGAHIVAEASGIAGDPLASEELLGALTVPLHQFIDGEIDQLYIATNHFQNMLVHQPLLGRLLPIDPALLATVPEPAGMPAGASKTDYLYEPDATQVIDRLMLRYIESTMYRAVAENIACEHAARMTAMQAASDNASRLIDELTLRYNKTRQEVITREIIEITAGADALKERP